MFTVLGHHRGGPVAARLPSFRSSCGAEARTCIVRAIPPVIITPAAVFSTCRRSNATSSKYGSLHLKLMTSITESAKFNLTLRMSY